MAGGYIVEDGSYIPHVDIEEAEVEPKVKEVLVKSKPIPVVETTTINPLEQV